MDVYDTGIRMRIRVFRMSYDRDVLCIEYIVRRQRAGRLRTLYTSYFSAAASRACPAARNRHFRARACVRTNWRLISWRVAPPSNRLR